MIHPSGRSYESCSCVDCANKRFAYARLQEAKPAAPDEGLKFDDSKSPMHLIPPEALDGMARVLGFGAKKYGTYNWAKGMDWSRIIGAAYRHLTAYNAGEDRDPETGELHVDHFMTCAAFLSAYYKRKVGTDDRFKPGPGTP
jgi:hypothetical protein